MKSTTFSLDGETSPPAHHFPQLDKWKALPFLIFMLSSSLPLNYKLEESRPMLVSDVAELTSEATASANSANSLWFVLFLSGLYLVSACMVLQKPRISIVMVRRQWPLALLMLLVAASMAWSYHPEKVMLNTVHNLGMMLVAMSAALCYRHDPWLLPKHLSYVLGVNMMLHIGAVVLSPSFAIDWQGRWKGLTTHPNTLGALGFTTLWANSVILICKKPKSKYPYLFFAALAISAMVGANSVTSIVTALCSVASIYAVVALSRLRAGRKFYAGMLLIACMLAAILTVLISQFDVQWLFDIFGRDSNFTGRTSVWEDALSAMSERPLLGWSFDDHAYIIETEGMAYPSYHNGWLDLGVSGGAVSIAIFIWLLAKWVREFTKLREVAREIVPISVSFVVGFLVHNLTEASLLSPRGQMWQIFLVLVLLGTCNKPLGANSASAVAGTGVP